MARVYRNLGKALEDFPELVPLYDEVRRATFSRSDDWKAQLAEAQRVRDEALERLGIRFEFRGGPAIGLGASQDLREVTTDTERAERGRAGVKAFLRRESERATKEKK